jgi:release factor glutamine methyltransferase
MSRPPTHAAHGQKAEMWTTRRLLKWMSEHFAAKEVDSPRVVAEMLLSHVLGCERLRLYMEVDRPASPAELTQLRELTARAAKHEPVQYLVGEAWFFGRQFHVNRSTLIPRPCTETLIEHAIQWHRLNPGHLNPLIADIGTGTACIAISLAAQIPTARVIATDVIPEALELAKMNATRHKVVDRMEFRLGGGVAPLMPAASVPQSSIVNRQSSIASGVPGERYDIICSNPPYIPDTEWDSQVDRNVKEFEPPSALRGGPDGLDVIRPLIAEAPRVMKPGGLLLIEIAESQREAVMELARSATGGAGGMLENITVMKDHEGLWRVLTANRTSSL